MRERKEPSDKAYRRTADLILHNAGIRPQGASSMTKGHEPYYCVPDTNGISPPLIEHDEILGGSWVVVQVFVPADSARGMERA